MAAIDAVAGPQPISRPVGLIWHIANAPIRLLPEIIPGVVVVMDLFSNKTKSARDGRGGRICYESSDERRDYRSKTSLP